MSARPTWTVDGRPLLAGQAEGVALVLTEPLSFWGGLDQASGLIIDERHPQHGADVTGRVLVMSGGRGSSSSSSVLAEAIRLGHGPAAIVLAEADEIVVLGALIVELLDGVTRPVIQLPAEDHGHLRTGDRVTIKPDGRVEVQPAN